MMTVIQDFTTEDIDYVRHVDRPLTLRLFRPAGAGPFPAVVVLHPQSGAVLGAIGVSGLAAQEDEDLSRLGMEALGL